MVTGTVLKTVGRRESLEFDSTCSPPVYYGGKAGGSMADCYVDNKAKPGGKGTSWDDASGGRVTERECDRLLTDSQPNGCEGSTPSPSAKTLEDIMNRMSKERRERIEKRVEELLEDLTPLYHTYSSMHPDAIRYTFESMQEFVDSLEGKHNPLEIEVIIKG